MADWPPLKNSAFTVVFPIYDADGDLVTAAASLDSEVSIDEGTFTDVSPGEATEIATSSGIYYLALAAGEMNGDRIATITKTATGGAKTAVNVMYTVTRQLVDLAYPATSGRSLLVETDGMVHADVKEWLTAAPLALASQRVQVEVDAYDAAVDFNATQKASIETAADASLVTYDGLVPADAPANWASMGIEADGHVHGDIKEWLGVAPNALQTGRVDTYVGAMAAAVIAAATFAAGAIDAAAIANGAIDAATFAAGAIDATAIANAAIDAATFTAGAIDASAIAADAIGASEIANGAIDAATFAAGAINAAAIATDAVDADAIAADAANEIADAILSRDVDNVEATAAVHTLCSAVLKAVSRIRDNAGTLEVYETNGSTLHMSQTVTVDAAADPVDELTAGV